MMTDKNSDAHQGPGAIIQDAYIEGDLVLRVPLERRFPVGWDRLRWAWRALRGEPYERPLGLRVRGCVIGKKLIEEWRLDGAAPVPLGSAKGELLVTGNAFAEKES